MVEKFEEEIYNPLYLDLILYNHPKTLKCLRFLVQVLIHTVNLIFKIYRSILNPPDRHYLDE